MFVVPCDKLGLGVVIAIEIISERRPQDGTSSFHVFADRIGMCQWGREQNGRQQAKSSWGHTTMTCRRSNDSNRLEHVAGELSFMFHQSAARYVPEPLRLDLPGLNINHLAPVCPLPYQWQGIHHELH